jgi:two-component system cell cycle response regulator
MSVFLCGNGGLIFLSIQPICSEMENPWIRISAGRRNVPGSRILLAMGISDERNRLAEVLSAWGHRVETSDDGLGLIACLSQRETVAIVIMDSGLPGISGLALTHQLQLLSRRRRVWMIALTDTAIADEKLLSRDAGIDDFLAKPIDEFELRVCLHTALRVQARYGQMVESLDAARHHATHDGLTGLSNRESLLTKLFRETDRAQRLGSPLALLLLDLDHFAQLNREHGYDGGDNVLRQLASRLRRHLRSYDLFGRCGEDEFLIAMPGGGNDDARAMASRLRDAIGERPFDILKASVRITASFGVAQSGGRSPLVVLREAETALNLAKLAGRNCIRFYDVISTDPAKPVENISVESSRYSTSSSALA